MRGCWGAGLIYECGVNSLIWGKFRLFCVVLTLANLVPFAAESSMNSDGQFEEKKDLTGDADVKIPQADSLAASAGGNNGGGG